MKSNRGLWTSVGLALVVLTWVVFAPTLGHGFLNFDDNSAVYENGEVSRGLTLHGVGHALIHSDAALWNPLTTISHMADCQLFGLNPAGHHFTNVLFHSLAALALFFALAKMTAAFWRSAFVAAIFAIHPLRVESVAWIAERKDVLSGFFFALTLGAYFAYAKRRTLGAYSTVFALFALALMSKAAAVTLPLVLLLLDYWPLQRFRDATRSRNLERRSLSSQTIRLLIEKVPLLLLSAASAIATLLAQKAAVPSWQTLPLSARVANAFVTSADYVWKTFWPTRLAVFYPYPNDGLPAWQIFLSILFLTVVTVIAFRWQSQRPYFLVGWLWYLIALLPNIGVIQAGSQARADRFTYLPQIGLLVLITWTAADISTSPKHRKTILTTAAIVLISTSALLAAAQSSRWQDSETLWRHTISVTPNNPVAHGALGSALMTKGKIDEAIEHFNKALELWPTDAGAYNNLGNALLAKNDIDHAIASYQKAIGLQPNNATARYNLGVAFFRKQHFAEAMRHYKTAAELQPDYPDVYAELGNTAFQQRDTKAAETYWRQSIEREPRKLSARHSLAAMFVQNGKVREALEQWRQIIDLNSNDLAALNALGWVLATSPDASIRDGAEALKCAQRANEIADGNNANVSRTLAAAQAENGRFSAALKTAQRASEQAQSSSNVDLVAALHNDLDLYRANKPVRDESLGTSVTR